MSKQKLPDVMHEEPDATLPRHKPEYWDMCEICKLRRERVQRVVDFHKAFVQFGYVGVTRQDVEEAYDVAMEREPVAEDPIFVRLIRTQLEEAGIV